MRKYAFLEGYVLQDSASQIMFLHMTTLFRLAHLIFLCLYHIGRMCEGVFTDLVKTVNTSLQTLLQVPQTGRRLRQSELHAEPEALNSNTVYVTLQINAGANFRTQAVKADVENALSAGGQYSIVPVQVCTVHFNQ